MLAVIQSRKYALKHNLNAALLSGVAVSGRRCILFYSNKAYIQYDPYLKQIVYQGSLPHKPFKTLLLNKNVILCLLQNNKLCRLSLQNRGMEIGCELPLVKTQDPFLDQEVVYNSQVNVFLDSGSYYVSLPYKNQNKRRILFFSDTNSFENTEFQFHNIQPVCEKLDDISKIVIYFQRIEEDVEWDIKIIDLLEGTDRRIIVESQLLPPGSIVSKIILKQQNQLYIFINGSSPTILILSLDNVEVRQVKYQFQLNFLEALFYNRPKNTICVSYLQHVKLGGEITENCLEIIDLDKLKSLFKVNVSLKSLSLPIENDYILDVGEEGKQGNTTIFHARHLVKKRAMLFHLIQKSGAFQRFGSAAVRKTLSLFDM